MSSSDSENDAESLVKNRKPTKVSQNAICPLNMDSGNMDLEWKNLFTRFKIFLIASGLDEERSERKVALLLHYLGKGCLDIFTSFNKKIEEVYFEELIYFLVISHLKRMLRWNAINSLLENKI